MFDLLVTQRLVKRSRRNWIRNDYGEKIIPISYAHSEKIIATVNLNHNENSTPIIFIFFRAFRMVANNFRVSSW